MHHLNIWDGRQLCKSKLLHFKKEKNKKEKKKERLETWFHGHPIMNIFGCKCVYKAKLNSDGSLKQMKACLVAEGFNQKLSINFYYTFSPVIRPATIRVILTVALAHSWDIRQLDVKNTFLHGYLSEIVLWEQPLALRILPGPLFLCQLNGLSMDFIKSHVLGLIDSTPFSSLLASFAVLLVYFYLFVIVTWVLSSSYYTSMT